MNYAKKRLPGIMISAAIAIIAYIISSFLPAGILGGTLIALILGMLLNPLLCKYEVFDTGLKWTSKIILRVGIILAGITLSFPQVLKAGKYALILMFLPLQQLLGLVIYVRKYCFRSIISLKILFINGISFNRIENQP